MRVRLRQLRAFKAIVENGSVSEAANTLGLTQSTVSKILLGFEAELGFQLFDRIGKRLSLSEQGRLFFRQADNAIELLQGIEATAADIRDNQAARFRVSAIGPLMMSAYLPRVLKRFSDEDPKFRFMAETKTRAEIEDWIASAHADVGFTFLPVRRGQLSSRSVARVRAVAIVPAGHALSERGSLAPGDLPVEEIVLPRPTVRLRNLVEASFIQAGVELRPWIETSNAVSTANLVAEGNGVAVIDPFTVTAIPAKKIAVVSWEPEILLNYGMIWAGNRSLSVHERRLANVAEAVAGEFSDELRWFDVV